MTEMNLFECDGSMLPEYYKEMYLDGFSPEEIVMAAHKKILDQHNERHSVDAVKIFIKETKK
jgi:hypothetical protein